MQKTMYVDSKGQEIYVNDLVEDKYGNKYRIILYNKDLCLAPLLSSDTNKFLLLKSIKINNKIDSIRKVK